MLRNFPAFSLSLPEVQRAREAPTEAVSVPGPGCGQDLTIDNTTLTVGHREKTARPSDNHYGGQGLSSQDGEHFVNPL